MANGRLAKDVQYLRKNVEAYSNGQARITDVDDNLRFVLLDILPNEGYYRGAKIRFKLFFDQEEYPRAPPIVVCLDEVYHPNIDVSDGVSDDMESSNVCVSLLDEWDSSMGLDHIVMALLFLMHNPNPDDALSPYFDSESMEDFTEATVRRTLKGGSYDGLQFPRLWIGDDDGDEDVEEETGEEGGGAPETSTSEEAMDVTVDACPESATSVVTDPCTGSQPVQEVNEAAGDRDRSTPSDSDLTIENASKAGMMCNRLNSDLTEYNWMLAPVFKSTKVDSAAEASDADRNSIGVKGLSRSVTCGSYFFCKSGVGTLFSNFLQMRENTEMNRSTPAVVNMESDVD